MFIGRKWLSLKALEKARGYGEKLPPHLWQAMGIGGGIVAFAILVAFGITTFSPLDVLGGLLSECKMMIFTSWIALTTIAFLFLKKWNGIGWFATAVWICVFLVQIKTMPSITHELSVSNERTTIKTPVHAEVDRKIPDDGRHKFVTWHGPVKESEPKTLNDLPVIYIKEGRNIIALKRGQKYHLAFPETGTLYTRITLNTTIIKSLPGNNDPSDELVFYPGTNMRFPEEKPVNHLDTIMGEVWRGHRDFVIRCDNSDTEVTVIVQIF